LPSAPSRVLDLGVGTGRELGALQDAGYEVTGLDSSPTMLLLCARRARPVPLVRSDLWSKLPFGDGAFDAVLALHGTLAHPPERSSYAKLAREATRVLRAEGVFVAEVPSRAWLERLPADGIVQEDGRLLRAGEDRLLHEDRTAGLAVEAVVPSESEWAASFSGGFEVSFEPLGDAETLVIGRRRQVYSG
jgi:SAM-dependent methyltransferase